MIKNIKNLKRTKAPKTQFVLTSQTSKTTDYTHESSTLLFVMSGLLMEAKNCCSNDGFRLSLSLIVGNKTLNF